jgi:hypothetical protein
MRHPSLLFAVAWWALIGGFVAQIGLGLSVAFGYGSPLWHWHRSRMAQALLGVADVPEALAPFVAQLAAMLGATMACWGLSMALVTAIPLRRRAPWAWWCVAGSAALWFGVDTALSASHGAWVNVAFNVAAGIMMGVPLAILAPWVLAGSTPGDGAP